MVVAILWTPPLPLHWGHVAKAGDPTQVWLGLGKGFGCPTKVFGCDMGGMGRVWQSDHHWWPALWGLTTAFYLACQATTFT